MESPDSIDARNYENTLALIGRVAPAMQADSQSRAAWSIVTAKLGLKAALAAEGFDLHAPTVPAPVARVTAPPAPPTAAQTAAQAAELADLRLKIHALRDASAPAPAAAEKKPMTAADAANLRLVAALMERAGLEGRVTPAVVADFQRLAADAAAETVEHVNAKVRAAQEQNPALSYYQAVRETSK